MSHSFLISPRLLTHTIIGVSGLVFAIGCFILFIAGLILDLMAFLGLLGVALGSLAWGRLKRVECPVAFRQVIGYFKKNVWE